jgi:hypothetical protein
VRDIAVLEEGPMRLGAGRHLVDAVPERVAWYRREVAFGPMYYDTPSPAADVLNASDLAFGTLLGAWGGRLMRRIEAFKAAASGGGLQIDDLPDQPLERCSEDQLRTVADGLCDRADAWDCFGVSTVSKVVHRRRRATVPILDRQAISGAFMSPSWVPGGPSQERRPSRAEVFETVAAIAADLKAADNESSWNRAAAAWPTLTRVELFDVLWWSIWRGAR